MLIADVAVPVPLGRPFSYSVPAALIASVSPGIRVLCQFGPRKTLGVVLDVSDREPAFDKSKLRPISAVVDSEPVLPAELLAFLRELSSYYLAPIGEVLRMALPALERTQVRALMAHDEEGKSLKGRKVGGREITMVKLRKEFAAEPQLPEKTKLRGRAAEVLEYLLACPETSVPRLEQRWKGARAAVKRLEALGLVDLARREVPSSPFFADPVDRDVPPSLNADQERASDALREA